MGYNGSDFDCYMVGTTGVTLDWYHTDPQPSEQEILDIEPIWRDSTKQTDMLEEGRLMTVADDARLSVGANPIVVNRTTHDSWMQTLYSDVDDGEITLPKPPPDERQTYTIFEEDQDPFVFTRYEDQWGFRWRMDLTRESANNLALYIQDSDGNYLYTTGALIDNGDGTFYTECPAGQADPTPEDVYFHWILGSGRISSDFKYAGSEDALEGIVRSDEAYD